MMLETRDKNIQPPATEYHFDLPRPSVNPPDFEINGSGIAGCASALLVAASLFFLLKNPEILPPPSAESLAREAASARVVEIQIKGLESLFLGTPVPNVTAQEANFADPMDSDCKRIKVKPGDGAIRILTRALGKIVSLKDANRWRSANHPQPFSAGELLTVCK